MHPTKKAAHIAGAVYLLLVLTAPFSLLYVPGKLIVRGNATATANMFAELAIMLWLLIRGARVPTLPSALQPATADLVSR